MLKMLLARADWVNSRGLVYGSAKEGFHTAQPLAATKTGTTYSATIDLPPIQVEQPNRCSLQRLGNVLVRRKQGIFSRR